VLTYWDTAGGIGAAWVLGGLLDAGAGAALVSHVLAACPLPRGAVFAAREATATGRGTAATVMVGPVGGGRRLIEAIHAVEDGTLPLAVRTWGGGTLRRLAEAEALVRGVAVDAVPLDDPLAVAEIVAVVAALASLRVVRVFAAPTPPRRAVSTNDERAHADAVTALLLEEAGWPEGTDAVPGAVVTHGGAALLAALAEPGPPPLRLVQVGYGVEGGALFPVWLGEPHGPAAPPRDRDRDAEAEAATAHAHPHPHERGEIA